MNRRLGITFLFVAMMVVVASGSKAVGAAAGQTTIVVDPESDLAQNYSTARTLQNSPEQLEWITAELALPKVLNGSGAAFWNGRLYITGGNSGTFQTGSRDVYFSELDANGNLLGWTSTTQLPEVRWAHHSVAINGQLFVIGGYPLPNSSAIVRRATILANGQLDAQWIADPHEQFPPALYRTAVVTHGTDIYVIGGYADNMPTNPRSDVFRARVNTDGSLIVPSGSSTAWQTENALPTAIHAHSAAVLNDYIYVTGGMTSLSGGISANVYAAKINADGSLGAWATAQSLPSPMHSMETIAFLGRLLVIGGTSSSSAQLDTVFSSTPGAGGVLGSWTTLTPLPEARIGHTVMTEFDWLFSLGGSGKVGIFVGKAPPDFGSTTRVSVSSDGAQGNSFSRYPALSADGRYVAFQSDACNLVAGDTNGTCSGGFGADIFVHDRQTGQTNRVSVSSDGVQGNHNSGSPAISADGRYVAFDSWATNLVAGDSNGSDIFVHDRQTGQTTRVSVSSDGIQGIDWSFSPAISADGRYVAYTSEAFNLVDEDTNDARDIVIHDRQTGQNSLVSVSSDGAQGNNDSYELAISADGRFVAFNSHASNLVAGDTNDTGDIFVHDRQTGQTSRVSVNTGGMQANSDSLSPAISADGRFVAFYSNASNLVAGDTNDTGDIFVHDRKTGQTSRVSVSSGGTQGNNVSGRPTLSTDGRYVAFNSSASNLVAGDTNEKDDIFVHDRQTGRTGRVSVSSGGEEGYDGHSHHPTLSADGRNVAFWSDASNLIVGDSNGRSDIFVHDRLGATQPGAITNLVGTPSPAAGMITLSWTVPPGTTSGMQTRIRYRTGGAIASESAWSSATAAGNVPAPLAAGQTQTFVVKGLEPGQTYYFAARLEDGAGNLTPLSNSPAAQAASPHVIDLTVSLWRAPNDADKAKYETIFQHFADAIYEMSNGAHVIGTVIVYQNKEHWDTAHVQWSDNMWPYATRIGYYESGKHVYMGDRHVVALWFDHQFLSQSNLRGTGYTLAHEWGHYYYGLYDEYAGACGDHCGEIWHPQPDDTPIHNSVMNSQWNATSGNYNWLNFSVASNYASKPGEPEKDTAQLRVYGASGWETLARATDQRNDDRVALTKRTIYPELAAVAPPLMANSPLELPTMADRVPDVIVNWVAPSPSALAATSSAAYAVINVLPHASVTYPEPALLTASVHMDYPITRAGIIATTVMPGGGTLPLALADDGVAPDAIAEDGVYSGYLPYSQNGTYDVSVTFDNAAGTAYYTQLGTSWSIGPNGETFPPIFEPVGEPFSAAATATVTVSGVQSDDHGETAGTATALPADNTDLTGRIDHSGDEDWFAVTPAEHGQLAVRLTNIGLGIMPRLRVLGADGTTVLADVTTPPAAGPYLFAVIAGDPEQTVYVEVSDTDPDAAGGVYDVSAGTPLPPETAFVAGPPQIAGFSTPGAAEGAGILISGVDLVDVSTVTFNGVAAAFAMVSDTELYAEVPVGATSGPVAVTTSYGTTTSWMHFLVVPAPALTGFSPVSGLPGTTVTIYGSNLSTVTAVAFNGEEAVAFTAISETQLTAVVPAMAASGKITATTLGGAAQSVGEFTVSSNQPPNEPANPFPTNGATDVATDVTLSWSATDPDNDPLTFEVHFGEADPPPQVVASSPTTTYDPPGDLAYGTTYYWQVIADDGNGGMKPGPVWSFTVTTPPESYSISGNVSEDIGLPMEGALVTDSSGAETYTDENGDYVLTGLQAGVHEVEVFYNDYEFANNPATVTLPPDAVDIDFVGTFVGLNVLLIEPMADAYVDEASKTGNFGTKPYLRVKNTTADNTTYLMFEVSGLSCAAIESVGLSLFTKDPGPDGGSVYGTGINWTETGITWNNAPAISGTALGNFGAVVDESWEHVSLANAVTGDGVYSFAVRSNSSNLVEYSSGEGAYPGWLQIEYRLLPAVVPSADFLADHTSGFSPLTVNFQDISTGCPTGWLWDFGDGTTSTAQHPSHEYTGPGTYEVSLTVSNAKGSDTETKTGYITVNPTPPEPDYFISPSGSATIGGIPSTPADILRYTKSTNIWTMIYDGSVRGTTKNVSAFDILDDGSLLLVFSANQAIAGLGTATPYDVVKFTPNTPGVYPLGTGTYSWFFQGKPLGLTTTGEKIDAMDLSGDQLLLSTTGTAKIPLLPSGTLSAPDEDVFAFNMTTSQWETALVIDGSLIPGMGGEDLASIWDDPGSSDYYITITGSFNLGGVKGNGKSIIKLTPSGGATVFTPSLVPWLAPGATFPSNLDGLALRN